MILQATFPYSLRGFLNNESRIRGLVETLQWIALHTTINRYELECLDILADWFYDRDADCPPLPDYATQYYLSQPDTYYSIRITIEAESFSSLLMLKYPNIKVSAA